MIYVVNYYSTRKFAMQNEWWLFTLKFHNVHEQGTSRSMYKWSAIYVFYWNNSCAFHMNILFEMYHIFIWIGDFDRMFSPVTFLLMSLTLVRFEMALSTRSVFFAFPLAFYSYRIASVSLIVIHKYILPHTLLFHCSVHNFGRLTCVSPQWNRPQCEHVTTPWRHH